MVTLVCKVKQHFVLVGSGFVVTMFHKQKSFAPVALPITSETGIDAIVDIRNGQRGG